MEMEEGADSRAEQLLQPAGCFGDDCSEVGLTTYCHQRRRKSWELWFFPFISTSSVLRKTCRKCLPGVTKQLQTFRANRLWKSEIICFWFLIWTLTDQTTLVLCGVVVLMKGGFTVWGRRQASNMKCLMSDRGPSINQDGPTAASLSAR